MGVKYTIPFKTTGNRGYCVRISTPTYTGKPIELTGAPSCVIVHQSGDDDLLTPVRHKNATISILTSRILTDLFSTAPMTNRVQIFKGSFDFNNDFNADFNGNAPVVVWSGWVKPEVYTQDWQHERAVMQLECESDLAVLSSLDYSEAYPLDWTMQSLGSMLRRAVSLTGGFYSHVIVPDTYSLGANNINALSVSEQAVKDGFTNTAKTWTWALEEWCKLLGWTLCEHGPELIFVDALATAKGVKYSRYAIDSIGTGKETVTPITIGVEDIKRRNTQGMAIDVVKSCNYVTVKGEAKDMDGAFPEPNYDDADMLKVYPADTFVPYQNKYYGTYKEVRMPKDHPELGYGWTLRHYLIGSDGSYPSRTSAQIRSNAATSNNYAGGMMVKAQMLEFTDAQHTITERNMGLEDALQIRTRSKTYTSKALGENTPCATLKVPCNLLQGAADRYAPTPSGQSQTIKTAGALCIDFSCLLHEFADLTWHDEALRGNGSEYPIDTSIRAQVRIGQWYFNGEYSQWMSLPPESMRYCDIPLDSKGKKQSSWLEVKTNKSIFHPYDTDKGFIIPLVAADGTAIEMEGDIEVTFCAGPSYWAYLVTGNHNTYGYTLKGVSVSYLRPTFVNTPTNKTYTRDTSAGGYKVSREIACSFTSHEPDHGHCWGDVALDGVLVESGLQNAITGSQMRPEELTARKVTELYATPRVKLTEALRLSNIKPNDMLTDPSLPGKRFLITGRETDLEYERERLTIVEV